MAEDKGKIDAQVHETQVMGQNPGAFVQYSNPMMQTGMLPGVPAGLEYLSTLSSVHVHQVFDTFEVLTGWERNNKYNILNDNEQQFFLAKEDTDCCTRQFLGAQRPFTMNITTMDGRDVIQVDRPWRCQGALCCCHLQEMTIMSPPGTVVGYVRERHTWCRPELWIENANGERIFDIVGENCCAVYCRCGDISFKVLSAVDNSEVGQIVKKWRGLAECVGFNRFSLHFPLDLDVNMKAILLGATFLVDFMFFEVQQK